MQPADLAVVGGSVAFLAAFYGWFFWPTGKTGVVAQAADGRQEIEIEVKGGYSPAYIVVERGRPVRLKFRREESNPCTDRVLVPGLRINRALAAHQTTTIDFTPTEQGEYDFHCGMNMLHGTLTVR